MQPATIYELFKEMEQWNKISYLRLILSLLRWKIDENQEKAF